MRESAAKLKTLINRIETMKLRAEFSTEIRNSRGVKVAKRAGLEPAANQRQISAHLVAMKTIKLLIGNLVGSGA